MLLASLLALTAATAPDASITGPNTNPNAAMTDAPLPARILASSSLPSWKGYTFTEQNLADGRADTSWQPQSKRGGVGEWVELRFSRRAQVSFCEIANGFQRRDAMGDLFRKNSRIKRTHLEFSDFSKQPTTLDPAARGLLRISTDNKATNYIILYVDEIAAGDTWNDLAVSEFVCYGHLVDTAARPKEPLSAPVNWLRSVTPGVELAKTETTVAAYAACVEAGACSKASLDIDDSENEGNKRSILCNWSAAERKKGAPINCVTVSDARAFCGWIGGRLPTDQEWDAEASNNGSREYPWGDEFPRCSYANAVDNFESACTKSGMQETWPVCSAPLGNSISGLCDMIGNVGEFVSADGGWAVHGGDYSAVGYPSGPVATFRQRHRLVDPALRMAWNGFRCARDTR